MFIQIEEENWWAKWRRKKERRGRDNAGQPDDRFSVSLRQIKPEEGIGEKKRKLFLFPPKMGVVGVWKDRKQQQQQQHLIKDICFNGRRIRGRRRRRESNLKLNQQVFGGGRREEGEGAGLREKFEQIEFSRWLVGFFCRSITLLSGNEISEKKL